MVRGISDIKKIVNKLSILLEKEGIHVEQVILYGSWAANKQTDASDIDLIVISNDFKEMSMLERMEFLSLISWNLPAPLEILGYTPKEIKTKSKDSIFWDQIEENGKIIFKAA